MKLFPDTVLANQVNSADSAYHLYAGLQTAPTITPTSDGILADIFIEPWVKGPLFVEPWVDAFFFIDPFVQIEDCFEIFVGDSGVVLIPPVDPDPDPDPPATPPQEDGGDDTTSSPTASEDESSELMVFGVGGQFYTNTGAVEVSPAPASTGWSVFNLHTSAKEVYTSHSDGDDTNDGLTISTPVKTLTKAISLVTQGKGDHILLKRGDTWPYSSSSLTIKGKGGLSSAYPTVMKPYGTGAMPVVQQPLRIIPDTDGAVGNSDFFTIQGIKLSFAYADRISGTSSSARNIIAIHFQSFGFGGGIKDAWIEGCTIVGARYGMNLQGVVNKTIYRNTFLDMYGLESSDGANDAPHSQGIWIGSSGGVNSGGQLRIEENVFDQCGGFLSGDNIIVDGTDSGVDALDKDSLRTWHNHALYHSQGDGSVGSNVLIKKNLVSRCGLAFQCRNGGIIEDNVFVVNAVHLGVGHSQQARLDVTATVDSNLFLGNEFTYTPANVEADRVQCILIDKVNSATISNNIAGDHGRSSPTSNVIFAKAQNGVGTSPSLTFQDNSTRNWDNQWATGGPYYETDSDSTYAETTSGGDFQDGTNTATTLFDKALADVGGTYAGYYAKVRAFNRDNWTADYYKTPYNAALAVM